MKVFNEMSNVGHAKYVVNYHDDVKTHEDGSPFYDIVIFSNKEKKDQFLRKLSVEGYSEKV